MTPRNILVISARIVMSPIACIAIGLMWALLIWIRAVVIVTRWLMRALRFVIAVSTMRDVVTK